MKEGIRWLEQRIYDLVELPQTTLYDVIGFGETTFDLFYYIEEIPNWGEKIEPIYSFTGVGGTVATFCTALSKWGLNSYLISYIGDDLYGEAIKWGLEGSSFNLKTQLLLNKGGISSHSTILVNRNSGERIVLNCKIVIEEEREKERILSFNLDSKLLHLDLSFPTLSLELAKRAKQKGILVSVDIDKVEPNFYLLLPFIDIAIFSEGIIDKISPYSDHYKAFEWIYKQGPFIVGETKGSSGSLFYTPYGLVNIEPYKIGVGVDSTGAGDIFRATFIYFILKGETIYTSLRLASIGGALQCQKEGSIPAIPDIESILKCGMNS